MEPLNLLRKARDEFSPKLISDAFPVTLEYRKAAMEVFDAAQAAPKFILPNGGRIFDDDLRGLDAKLRLPFDSVVIEYTCRGLPKSTLDVIFGEGQLSNAPERIVYAKQEGESVKVYSIIHMNIQGEMVWFMQPYVAEIIMDANEKYIAPPEVDSTKLIGCGMALQEIGGMGRRTHGDMWPKHAYYDMLDETRAVLELIEALSCSNVRAETLPSRKLNKSAAKRGALPFDTYHVLTVGWAKTGEARGESGDRRSPREHLRRGHIRNLADGRKVWVNSAVVNAGIGARVSKEYSIAA